MNAITTRIHICMHLQAAVLVAILFMISSPAAAREEIIIAANGGGSGPLADTLPAITLTATSEIDYIELKISVTGDNAVLVYPSPFLDEYTDVAEIFPDRARDDGRFHVVDFTLAEVRQLRKLINETSLVPAPALGIPTLAETLSLLKTLERDLKRSTGIAPCILHPGYYRKEGKEISRLMLSELQIHNFTDSRQVIVQSDDGDELQRIKKTLFPTTGLALPLLQRIDRAEEQTADKDPLPLSYDHTWMFTRLGLRVVSSYADIVALHTSYIDNQHDPVLPATFIDDARALGLKIYIFPLDGNPASLPGFADTYPALLDHYYSNRGVDGIITTSPMQTIDYLKMKRAEKLRKQQEPRYILNTTLRSYTGANEKEEHSSLD